MCVLSCFSNYYLLSSESIVLRGYQLDYILNKTAKSLQLDMLALKSRAAACSGNYGTSISLFYYTYYASLTKGMPAAVLGETTVLFLYSTIL